MKTVCHRQMSFESLLGKKFMVDFGGGRITSDGGGLLLRELDLRYGLTEGAARCLDDPRDPRRISHELTTLLAQRIYAIALGYEDANDATKLRHDPVLKAMVGRLPESCGDLASQPTLSRFENGARRKDLLRLSDWLMRFSLKVHPGPRDVILIDLDSTDDPTHGHQQLSLFHGHFGQYMYHPLLVFDGLSGFPMGAVLRPGNAHDARGAVSVLKRMIRKLKRAYPGVPIVLRADGGFAMPEIYELCERERIYYVIGISGNKRLQAKVEATGAKAQAFFEITGVKQRLFAAFGYRAQRWNRSRRIIAKVEHLDKGLNVRFLVTNFLTLSPRYVYDRLYVLRGEVENWIKELKLELRADRLSCHRFAANQFRLLLHTAAYALFWLLRRHLKGTDLATAQVGTLRLKLLKIGARIKETTRRIWVHYASGYPYQELFSEVVHALRTAPA